MVQSIYTTFLYTQGNTHTFLFSELSVFSEFLVFIDCEPYL